MNLKRGIDREWARKAPAADAPVSAPANGNGHGDAATRHANGAAANGQTGNGHAPNGRNGHGAGESPGQVGRRLSDFILGEGLINTEQFSMVLAEQCVSTGGEKYPEVSAERVWEALIKKLLQKDYKFDAGFYGALNEFSRKVAYFFHASLQGTGCPP